MNYLGWMRLSCFAASLACSPLSARLGAPLNTVGSGLGKTSWVVSRPFPSTEPAEAVPGLRQSTRASENLVILFLVRTLLLAGGGELVRTSLEWGQGYSREATMNARGQTSTPLLLLILLAVLLQPLVLVRFLDVGDRDSVPAPAPDAGLEAAIRELTRAVNRRGAVAGAPVTPTENSVSTCMAA